jgi:hypothetical protein
MAGYRLEFWSTLPFNELKRRVLTESSRLPSLTFEEEQLLISAQERLRTWREPIRNSREIKMNDVTKTEDTVAPAPVVAPVAKEKKVVAKSKAKKPTVKKVVAKAKSNGGSRISPEAKVIKTSKGNPFKEGTGAYKRVELVLKNSGKTAGTIAKLAGLKSSTLSNCKRLGLIKIEA